jgi:hypothetical protein
VLRWISGRLMLWPLLSLLIPATEMVYSLALDVIAETTMIDIKESVIKMAVI